ncbi:glutamine synthetase family protein [Aurantimonas sp. VKM B-3413]|uniref:glutamine synthetase family protein n=1 Tax=Aurantimonas sp. VKM B-3413 TaxID=2779401 RepID=UPI001E31C9FE|nr:glutamine synthetase family protein [Aurantimonas sp. VKM B-3413]MCB8839467.1 glutamine synthetase family protein [Aurantimonas sp. VKM B-3413]
MLREPMTMLCYTDLSGAVRGKGFPTRLLEKRLKSGIGWTPTNLMFTALGTIADSVWSSFGDLTLMPDPETRVEVDFDDGTPAERFFLCDVENTDGTPWDCCPRTLLKDAVKALRDETGLELRATFEHEFVYAGANSRTADNYALDAVRRHGAFGETFLAALAAAGHLADSYLPEFAAGQFEVTVPPAPALAACDGAVVLREMARATAWRLGSSVSFSPRLSPEGLGSGVHIHFSLWDEAGNPVSHDASRAHGVGEKAGNFLAGIVSHMPALLAFTAPSPVSYLRLVPHAWTGIWSNIGVRDREAGIRICPTFGGSEEAMARQFNFEYRAADATANPYLALAVIIRAGLAGLRDGCAMPEPTVEEDPEAMSEEARQARGIVRLPSSVDQAFAALEADETVKSFLPKPLLAAYLANKRAEFEIGRTWTPEEICRRYAEVY